MTAKTMLALAAGVGGSAAIGALTSTLFARRAEDLASERLCRGYTAMAAAFWTMPDPGLPPPPGRARLALVQGEGGLDG